MIDRRRGGPMTMKQYRAEEVLQAHGVGIEQDGSYWPRSKEAIDAIIRDIRHANRRLDA